MSIVSIIQVQGDRVLEAVRQAVEWAGGFEIAPGSTVLLKPNVVHPSPSVSSLTNSQFLPLPGWTRVVWRPVIFICVSLRGG